MRLFVAVEIDDQLKPKILEIQQKLHFRGIKLVEPENLHFTLKFLGEQTAKNIAKIKHILENIASKHKPFNVTVSGVGVFPSEKFIRVIWLGSSGLEPLLSDVQSSLAEFRKEDYDPHPHLTLGRVRSYSPEIVSAVQQLKNTETGAMAVNSFSLKQSVLKRTGPVYEDVKRFELS